MYRPLKKSANEPGPGEHTLPSFPAVLPTSKDPIPATHSIPRAPRLKTARVQGAGPGSYSPRLDSTLESCQSFEFGHSERLVAHEGSVGSGANAAFTTGPDGGKDTWDGPKFGFPKAQPSSKSWHWSIRPSPAPGQGVPGPGKAPDEKASSKWQAGPSVTMSPRTKHVQCDNAAVPGPAAYKACEAQARISKAPPQCAFPTTKRFGATESQRRKSGPALYSTAEKTRRGAAAGPRWTLGGKTRRELTFSTLH